MNYLGQITTLKGSFYCIIQHIYIAGKTKDILVNFEVVLVNAIPGKFENSQFIQI